MAVTSYQSIPTTLSNAVTFKEAVAMFKETGHPISQSTLERIAHDKGYKIERVGRVHYVSNDDLLEGHADWVRSQTDTP